MARYETRVTTPAGRHYTSVRPAAGGEPAGWSVQCPDLLTEPYNSEAGAYGRMGNIERVGFCPHEHRVVPVWETFVGRKGGPSKTEAETIAAEREQILSAR